MPGDVKIPGLGEVDKKKAAVGGIIVAVGVVGIIAVRRRTAGSASSTQSTNTTGTAAAADTSGDDSGIDPATGIPYAEEEAGYSDASDYGGNGAVGSGTSDYDAAGYPIGSEADLQWQAEQDGTSTITSSSGITTNADWVTEAESGVVPGSVSTISAAVAKILGGIAVTSAQRDLFLEIVGVIGEPPQGYPQPIKLTDTSAQPSPAKTHTITADGSQDVSQIARANKTTGGQLLLLNPGLSKFYPGTKKVPKGYKVKVP